MAKKNNPKPKPQTTEEKLADATLNMLFQGMGATNEALEEDPRDYDEDDFYEVEYLHHWGQS